MNFSQLFAILYNLQVAFPRDLQNFIDIFNAFSFITQNSPSLECMLISNNYCFH